VARGATATALRACLVGPAPSSARATATGTARALNGPAAFPTKIVLAAADDGVLQAYRVAMVERVARDPAAGVLLALSAVLVVLVSRAGWGLLAVGVLLSGAAVVKVLLGAAR